MDLELLLLYICRYGEFSFTNLSTYHEEVSFYPYTPSAIVPTPDTVERIVWAVQEVDSVIEQL